MHPSALCITMTLTMMTLTMTMTHDDQPRLRPLEGGHMATAAAASSSKGTGRQAKDIERRQASRGRQTEDVTLRDLTWGVFFST